MRGDRCHQRGRGYQYGERPFREELIHEFHDEHGHRIAAVTRNYDGALALNTARVAFVDIDLPVPGLLYPLQRFVTRLFGSPTPHPAEERTRRLFEWAEQARDCALRIYETHSGYRVMVTDPPMDPTGEAAQKLLSDLEADPLYRMLCRRQACFRARLTPKHWRCGLKPGPPHRYPFLDQWEEANRRKWEREYDRIARSYATCRPLQQVGDGAMSEEVARIVEIHDEWTRCQSDLPLA
jgi:hypothetical protein